VAPDNVRRCESALSRILGRAICVSIDDPGGRQAGAQDEFTRNVAELFSGQIEEPDR
jgi:hypothetical protein